MIQKVTRGWLASKGADIASAGTVDLGAVEGFAHDITGTTTITSFGTVAAGIHKVLKFEGALTITHNATSMILPGGSSITTAVGDIGWFISEGSGNWRCLFYSPTDVSPFISVRRFGVTLDGATDDTTAYQAAITAVQGTATALYHPPGTAKITAALTVSGAIKIFGAGREVSVIQLGSTTQNGLAINTDTGCHFEGFRITAAALATAGSGIIVNGNATHNLFGTFRDLQFSNCWNGISTVNAADWTVDNCYFVEYKNIGILVDDQYDEDAGDSTVIASTFSTTQVAGEAIKQSSSGGLKLIGNKFIGGKYGYHGVIVAAAQTSILVINGNSIENQTTSGIEMTRAAVGAQFSNLVISGNQIGGQPNPINFGDANAGWLSDICITGNVIDIVAAGGTGITITAASGYHVSGNTITGQGGTTFGVAIGSAAGIGTLGVNNYSSITTHVDRGSTSCFGPPVMTMKGSGAQVTTPLDTAENIVATITIPANIQGLNGTFRINAAGIVTNSANTKKYRVREGGIAGVICYENSFTASVGISFLAHVQNRNATNSQIGRTTMGAASGLGGTATTLNTGTVATSAATTIVITIEKSLGAEDATLEGYSVEFIPG